MVRGFSQRVKHATWSFGRRSRRYSVWVCNEHPEAGSGAVGALANGFMLCGYDLITEISFAERHVIVRCPRWL